MPKNVDETRQFLADLGLSFGTETLAAPEPEVKQEVKQSVKQEVKPEPVTMPVPERIVPALLEVAMSHDDHRSAAAQQAAADAVADLAGFTGQESNEERMAVCNRVKDAHTARKGDVPADLKTPYNSLLWRGVNLAGQQAREKTRKNAKAVSRADGNRGFRQAIEADREHNEEQFALRVTQSVLDKLTANLDDETTAKVIAALSKEN